MDSFVYKVGVHALFPEYGDTFRFENKVICRDHDVLHFVEVAMGRPLAFIYLEMDGEKIEHLTLRTVEDVVGDPWQHFLQYITDHEEHNKFLDLIASIPGRAQTITEDEWGLFVKQ